jgi:hypothetical protein
MVEKSEYRGRPVIVLKWDENDRRPRAGIGGKPFGEQEIVHRDKWAICVRRLRRELF